MLALLDTVPRPDYAANLRCIQAEVDARRYRCKLPSRKPVSLLGSFSNSESGEKMRKFLTIPLCAVLLMFVTSAGFAKGKEKTLYDELGKKKGITKVVD